MSRWFRFYEEALDDPKVQKLDGDTFKTWVNLLCLASRGSGFLPPIADVAFGLRLSVADAGTVLERMLSATLIDKLSGGADGYRYAPHGWHERQYKSDTSTERVKRYRERSKTATVTAPETETEQRVPLDKESNGAAVDSDKLFWDSAKAYLGKGKASLIGQWVRDHGKDQTAAAITAAQLDRAVNPVEFIQGRFRKEKSYDPYDPNFKLTV